MTKIFEVQAGEQGRRLDVYLKSKLDGFSREKIKKAILAGQALINNQAVVDPDYKVLLGEVVSLTIEAEPKTLQPEQLGLSKVYEDGDFVVIDKPAGLVVHPGAGQTSGTLANALIYDYPEIAGLGAEFRPGIVHRLDKDTSGLMLIAKNEPALNYAKDIFKKREVTKEYLSLVHGRLETNQGLIDKPLLLAPHKRKVVVHVTGKSSLTEYKVLAIYQNRQSLDQYSFVRVILHTGRTHQIRVHMSSIGHPLVGDQVYGRRGPAPDGLNRQFLHAARLSFKLPNATVLDVQSPLPDDLAKVLANLEKVD